MSATKTSQHKPGTTKQSLVEKCKAIPANIDGQTLMGEPKVFSTGSVGWYINGKALVTLANGEKVWAQVGCNVTIVGSKELPA
jgi:hypothetical protein